MARIDLARLPDPSDLLSAFSEVDFIGGSGYDTPKITVEVDGSGPSTFDISDIGDILRDVEHIGGNGNDALLDGKGSDTFIFDKNDGYDTIGDWEDHVRIWVTSGARKYGRLAIEETEGGVLVSWRETTVEILGVSASEIGREHFEFG